MKVECEWNGRQNFAATINGFRVLMDAVKPFGDETNPTPKQLVLASLCGCTGMDVVGLLNRNKQDLKKLAIEADADVANQHPHRFTNIKLKYLIDGKCDPSQVAEAVNLSQTRYCAVSGMLSQGTTITYEVSLNGEKIATGISQFKD